MKRAAGERVDRLWSAFPGRIAGASLKPVSFRRRVASNPAFPRQNRRGLIEAATFASHC